MQQRTIDLNTATFVGIDAHPSEHTAVAVNRFEEEKGTLNFENNWNGIKRFLSWLKHIDNAPHNVIIGVEGRGGKGSGFIASMLDNYEHVYEVNPQYTTQRRQFGTKGGKSDVRDAKCIAEVIIKKLPELPKITRGQLSSRMLTLKRLVWYYEEETTFSTRLQHHLRQLRHEHDFSIKDLPPVPEQYGGREHYGPSRAAPSPAQYRLSPCVRRIRVKSAFHLV